MGNGEWVMGNGEWVIGDLSNNPLGFKPRINQLTPSAKIYP